MQTMGFTSALMKMTEGYRVRRKGWSVWALQAYIKTPSAPFSSPHIYIDDHNGCIHWWKPRLADLEAYDWVIVTPDVLEAVHAEEARRYHEA